MRFVSNYAENREIIQAIKIEKVYICVKMAYNLHKSKLKEMVV